MEIIALALISAHDPGKRLASVELLRSTGPVIGVDDVTGGLLPAMLAGGFVRDQCHPTLPLLATDPERGLVFAALDGRPVVARAWAWAALRPDSERPVLQRDENVA